MSAAVRRVLFGTLSFILFFTYLIIGEIEVIGGSDSGVLLLAAALGSGIGVACLGLIWWANGLWPGRRSAVVVVSESLGLGAMVALTFITAGQLIGLDSTRDPLLMVVSTSVTLGFFGYVFVVVDQARSNEQERRLALLHEGATLADAREEVADIVHNMQVVLDTDIDAALSPARIGIAESLAARERELTSDDWTAIAAALRTTARETVRPLSRQLWSGVAPTIPGLSFTRILRAIVTQQPFQPFTLAVVYVVTSLANAITLLGWFRGLVSLVTGILLIFAILGSANVLMRRHPHHHVSLFISAAAVLQLLGLINFPLRAWLGVAPYTWLEFSIGAILGVALILLTSGLGSVRTHRESVARTLQSDIDRELLASIAASRQVAQLARESARILHGQVQTRLIACAVAIERAASTHDVAAFDAALREAHAVLVQPSRRAELGEVTLVEEVERKVALWSGLCSITSRVGSTAAILSGQIARDAGRVVEEGLVNAVRHGGANAISVTVHGAASEVEIVIDDDGTGPGSGTAGLGSAMLDSVTTSWELTETTTGARLRAVVAGIECLPSALRAPQP